MNAPHINRIWALLLVAALAGCTHRPSEPPLLATPTAEVSVIAEEDGRPRDIVVTLASGPEVSWVAWTWPLPAPRSWLGPTGFGAIEVLPFDTGRDEIQAVAEVILVERGGQLDMRMVHLELPRYLVGAGEIPPEEGGTEAPLLGTGFAHHDVLFTLDPENSRSLKFVLAVATSSNRSMTFFLHLRSTDENIKAHTETETLARREEVRPLLQHQGSRLDVAGAGHGGNFQDMQEDWFLDGSSKAVMRTWSSGSRVEYGKSQLDSGIVMDRSTSVDAQPDVAGRGLVFLQAVADVDETLTLSYDLHGILLDEPVNLSNSPTSCGVDPLCPAAGRGIAQVARSGHGAIDLQLDVTVMGLISQGSSILYRLVWVAVDLPAVFGFDLTSSTLMSFSPKGPARAAMD